MAAGRTVRPRFQPAAVELTDGRVLVIGGDTDFQRTAELWLPAQREFVATGSPAQRLRSSPPGQATLLPDGRVLYWTAGHEFAEVWDPATGRFSHTEVFPAQPGFRVFGSLVRAGDDVMTIGELQGADAEGELVLRLDPGTRRWSGGLPPISLPGPAQVIALANGEIALLGAFNFASWSPKNGMITPVQEWPGHLDQPGFGWTAARLGDSRVLIAGGEVRTDEPFKSRSVANVVLWEPGHAPGRGTDLPAPRSAASATAVAGSHVVVIGGRDESAAARGEAFLFGGPSGGWTPAGTLAVPRLLHRAIALADGSVLVLGGSNGADCDLFTPSNCPAQSTAELWLPE